MSVNIQLEWTPNPSTLKYVVDRRLLSGGAVNFTQREEAEKNQPTWLCQNPWRGECTSCSVSACRWWRRWCAAHHSGPRCTLAAPSTAKANCTGREVLKARCEK